MSTPHVLLIDDHAMFRSGLKLVILSAMAEAVIHEAGSLQEAVDATPDRLDVVLLDIHLRGLSGLEGLVLLKRKWPEVPVLMVSSQTEPETVRLALARGAAGFVSKAETADHIVQAICKVLQGPPAEGLPSAIHPPPARSLTPRQCEVLDLLNQGLSNKLMARRLALSDNTVRRHVQDILEFFDVGSRAEAVAAARQQRLIG
ncbi:response regulator transcription factor [Paucibacter sp. DJ1R-11]|uniref:response regulator transcription factor n=1 Tax=Paucibacter sp. DJ1R-11 TaxID=2893556 RepID=UPI0021E4A158|nr:response regulator transcription factor [Paucibacter sp. DJ1R-11]MCV2363276.1 response regulator transcription factor [Paucibacter sp. DJ1R-11]